MAKKRIGPSLQDYPREKGFLLSDIKLFPPLAPPMKEKIIEEAIDAAFNRCIRDKKGKIKRTQDTPEKLVSACIKHLRERSDPILGSYFISQLKAEDVFELDAVSHEMQRHRMTIGVFYQYLILELMRKRWPVFDGTREGDIVADIDTPSFERGLRLYMSVKKSKDTVGGQDIGGVIRRLENIAKDEKNLTSPYLCIVGVATPAKGRIAGFNEDRAIKCNKEGQPYSQNCEYWGPGFIFPYVTGRGPIEIYMKAIKRVAAYLPFKTLEFREECSKLLKEKLKHLGLLDKEDKIDRNKFLIFIVESKVDKKSQESK
ncbi:MAG: hypothetical protein HZC48_03230 [Nitrospirae bacterium]|nr:hypothetical protein [Nitrospirota bacterium]